MFYEKPARWLITGGCGFIGLNLIKDLLSEGGHYIRIVDNLSTGTREALSQVCLFTEIDPDSCDFFPQDTNPLNSSFTSPSVHRNCLVECIFTDILDAETAIKATENIDVIVHLAANTGVDLSVRNPRSDCLNNIVGTLNYLEAARHNSVSRFVFASSGAPVGECEPPVHEELPPHPVSPYGASKLSGEAYCSAYYHTFGIETVSLRFGNVYGPMSGHKNSVVAKFIKRALGNLTLEIYGDGKQTRDFIYIDDLVRAIRLASSVEGIGGETFQIATSEETSVEELVEGLHLILLEYGITNVKVDHQRPRVGDVRRNFSNTSKARNLLGWTAKITLSEGLKRTAEWFLDKQTR